MADAIAPSFQKNSSCFVHVCRPSEDGGSDRGGVEHSKYIKICRYMHIYKYERHIQKITEDIQYIHNGCLKKAQTMKAAAPAS